MSEAGHRPGLLTHLAIVASAVFCGQALAQSYTAPEQRPRPVTDAAVLSVAPVLDGKVVGDAAWEGVVPATGFTQVQPVEGAPASEKTEVFIGFTDTAMYIGVIAYDEDPSRIIVSDSRRDSTLDDGDSFRVIIDGLMDRQNGFLFGTNPAGVEYDAQVIK